MAEFRKPHGIPGTLVAHIIFVHGLNGDKTKAWLSSTKPKEFWPDWLLDDISGVAVWSLGYPADASYWKRRGGAMALPDRAANILPALIEEPALKSGPIIFVAYSLGGLVVKEVLRLAEAQAPHDQRIADFLRRVRQIVFIGTPHFGSDQASLANLFAVPFRPRETTTGLSRNDPHLRALNTWFRSFVETSNIDVLVLRESKPMRYLGMIVKPDSADPGLSPAMLVIPIAEDHDSIRSPRNRDADVYKRIVAFIDRPFEKRHPDTILADGMASVANRVAEVQSEVRLTRDGLGDLANSLASGIPVTENPVVSAEAERRLWQLRKCRYIPGFEAKNECTRLLHDVRSGELLGASKEIRRRIFAWCSRVVAAVDLAIAQEALTEAQRLGSGEENVIAHAFFLLFSGNDKPAAHATLAELNTPMSRSAGFLVAAHGVTPDSALKWLTDTETRFVDLDPDGKQQVLARRIQAGDWTGALTDAESLAEADFETTPVLLVSAATVYLAQAIHRDLRGVLSHLLIETDAFPLGEDASSMVFRTKAKALYEAAAKAFAALGCNKAAGSATDHALWLSLRDLATAEAARRELETSMADPKLRLRRLPMALAFGLKLDLALVEREIDRETTLSGGKSIEAAIARFAVANTRPEPREFAAYIADHRAQLIQYYNPEYIDAFEVELLARSGQIAEARSKLTSLEDKGTSAQVLATLSRIIDEAAGADGVAIRERQYTASGTFSDLYSLVQVLKESKASSQLAIYGKRLFDETKDISSAEVYVNALYEQNQNQEIIELAKNYPELIESSEMLGSIVPWAYYRHGDLLSAKALLSKVSVSRDISNDRLLFVNIAIAAGDWNSLGTFVESEWTHRDERDAAELLRAGQLAQRIGPTGRSQELIREAAKKADGNPQILVGCYSAATSAGWEDAPAIHEWLNTAIEASGEDGPIQKVDLRELLDRQPDWKERERRVWDALLGGSVPMFAAAQTLKRTLLQMYLVPALSNLTESDPRKRGLIFAFSGARPFVRPLGKRWGLDVTSILTLSLLGLLEKVIDASDSVTIAHTTLGWLFQEREELQFHQPSRVRDALEIKRLLDSSSLQRFDGASAPAALEHEVGHEMARYLVAATTIDEPESAQKIVIRPYPLHKPETFMDEVADISGYEKYIAGCIDLIAALHKLGRITAAEEQRARSYLASHERPWPHNQQIETGATLFLDTLAVTYLQHIGLLERLKQAGFTVFISGEEIDTDNALVRYEAMGDEAKRIIENIRDILARNISTGKISLTPLAERDPDEPFELRQHPTMVLFGKAQDINSFVIDDRFQNQHIAIGTSNGEKSISTSIDLIMSLEEENLISTSEFTEAIATLRRAGLLLVPHRPSEILELINRATVSSEHIQETAELRAVRESVLRAQMTDTLQLPREGVWLDGLARQLIDAIRAQWNDDISKEVARARSNWLLSLFDTRGWSHRIPEGGPSVSDRYRTQMLALSLLPDASNDVRERYWRWFEDAALAQFREESPDDYAELVARIEALITKSAEEVAQGGIVG